MKELNLVLEDFDKFYDSAVAHIEGAVKGENARIILRVEI
jgi:hypothetical protein